MRILVSGDLHLGRRPSRLPADQTQHLTVGTACNLIAEAAIEQHVDAVLLSGDVIDRENAFFEAWGPLETALQRLKAEGIPCLAVAGNHDFDVLPTAAQSFDDELLTVLGIGGRWQQHEWSNADGQRLRVMGWSFPQQFFGQSPLHDWQPPPHDGIPTIGLLHADLDQRNSDHGPVTSAELRGAGVDAWILGHIHAPHLSRPEDGCPILYPGSPLALDPGEPGPHGPWLLELHGAPATWTWQQCCRSPVRYETLDVNVSETTTVGDVQQRIVDACREHVADCRRAGGDPQLLVARLRLSGRTAAFGKLAELTGADTDYVPWHDDQCQVIVERVLDHSQPTLDLERLAHGHDLVGLTAQLILGLEAEATTDDALQRLLDDAAAATQSVHRAAAFAPVADESVPDATQTRQWLIDRAWQLLDSLMEQKSPAHEVVNS